jgi:hypothetical protein
MTQGTLGTEALFGVDLQQTSAEPTDPAAYSWSSKMGPENHGFSYVLICFICFNIFQWKITPIADDLPIN